MLETQLQTSRARGGTCTPHQGQQKPGHGGPSRTPRLWGGVRRDAEQGRCSPWDNVRPRHSVPTGICPNPISCSPLRSAPHTSLPSPRQQPDLPFPQDQTLESSWIPLSLTHSLKCIQNPTLLTPVLAWGQWPPQPQAWTITGSLGGASTLALAAQPSLQPEGCFKDGCK